MKKVFTLITLFLLLSYLGAYAGSDWQNFQYGRYSGQCVVYAELVDGSGRSPINGNNLWGYVLGAFINGECRGKAVPQASYFTPAAGEVCYFDLRIEGTAADNGKTVEFRLLAKDDYDEELVEYAVAGTTPYKYQNGFTPSSGPYSNRHLLTFIKPTLIALEPNPIHVNVGQTIDLNSYVKITPSNANKPINTKFEGDYPGYISLTGGHFLTGLKKNDNMNTMWAVYKYGNKELARASVVVEQPVTGLILASGYENGIVVNLNDERTLTTYVQNAFKILPEGATARLQLTPSDPTALVEQVTHFGWLPKKVGDYTITATTGSFSATLKVKVQQRTTSLKTYVSDLYVYKGKDITDLVKGNVYANPAGSVYNKLKFRIENGTSVRMENNGDFTAVEEGDAVVYASTFRDSIFCSFTVHVQPHIESLTVTKDPLTIEWHPNGNGYQDISAEVLGNFAFAPTAPAANKYQFTSDNSNIVKVGVDPAPNYYVYANSLGTAHLTVTYTDKETRFQAGSAVLYNDDRTVTKTFTVTVVQNLTAFTFDNVVMGHRSVHELKVTPVPATAGFDPAKLSIVITNDDTTFPSGWKFAEVVAADATGHNWTIKPRSVGKGMIEVQYNGKTMGRGTIVISQELRDAAGWQWRAYFAAAIDKPRLQQVYGDKLLEIRSDKDLLYNDDQYGYFGTLKDLDMNKCYKVRLKDDVSPVNATVTTSTINYQPTQAFHIQVKQPWTWMGYPYQYDRPLSSISFGRQILTGSRIVSKDGGFAEYNGSDWIGNLTTLKAGEGYMFYNPDLSKGMDELSLVSESTLSQPAAVSPAKRNAPSESSVWTYNSSAFADNMTIIAKIPDLVRASDCTVGAFVGNECRGEGSLVEGMYFITVHGQSGEMVSFKLYDQVTGEYHILSGVMPFDKLAGSLAKPTLMNVEGLTSVEQIRSESSEITVSDGRLYFNGIRVKSFRVSSVNGSLQLLNDTNLIQLPSGVYIVTVVTTDGRTLSKKVVR